MNLEKRATSHYVRKPVLAVHASDIFAFSCSEVSTAASPSSLPSGVSLLFDAGSRDTPVGRILPWK